MKKLKLFLLSILLSTQIFAQSELDELIQKGVELHEAGKYDEAIQQYKKVLQIDENSSAAMYESSFSYFSKGDYVSSVSFADQVIKLNQGYIKEAMLIKGSALDNQGLSEQAILVYEAAAEKFPYDHLLFYNLGLTYYGLKKNLKAEDALLAALELNPDHASSHLLLAYLKINEGKRIEPILVLYTFLLLEPDTERAKQAYKLLVELQKQGVRENNDTKGGIEIELNGDENEFQTAELMLSLQEASQQIKTDEKKSEIEYFIQKTEALVITLDGLKKDKKGVWWEFYGDLLFRIEKAKHLKAFCYYISWTSPEKEVTEWLETNQKALEDFGKWLQE